MDDLYFGTREFMTWIPCPSINMPRGKQGWTAEASFISGGAGVKRSLQGARRYEMDWPMRAVDRNQAKSVDLIHAFAEGAYGPGPFYFIDPQAASQNLAPAHLAHPWLAVIDGPNLAGVNEPRPVGASAPPSVFNHPLRSAVYTLTGSETPLKTWFPIPPGYTLYVGGRGATTGTAELSLEYDSTPGVYVDVNLQSTDTHVLASESVNYATSGGGVSVLIRGTGTITLNSVTVLLVKDGGSPRQGFWITGKGNSGCEFLGFPTDTLYSSEFDMQVTSAVLQEVGGWQ